MRLPLITTPEEQAWLLVERQRQQVTQATWGHLFPDNGDHKGFILFAVSEYGDQGRIVIECAFEGVDDSPWFYGAMMDFIERKDRFPGVYRFDGVLRSKNHKLTFVGKVYRQRMARWWKGTS